MAYWINNHIYSYTPFASLWQLSPVVQINSIAWKSTRLNRTEVLHLSEEDPVGTKWPPRLVQRQGCQDKLLQGLGDIGFILKKGKQQSTVLENACIELGSKHFNLRKDISRSLRIESEIVKYRDSMEDEERTWRLRRWLRSNSPASVRLHESRPDIKLDWSKASIGDVELMNQPSSLSNQSNGELEGSNEALYQPSNLADDWDMWCDVRMLPYNRRRIMRWPPITWPTDMNEDTDTSSEPSLMQLKQESSNVVHGKHAQPALGYERSAIYDHLYIQNGEIHLLTLQNPPQTKQDMFEAFLSGTVSVAMTSVWLSTRCSYCKYLQPNPISDKYTVHNVGQV